MICLIHCVTVDGLIDHVFAESTAGEAIARLLKDGIRAFEGDEGRPVVKALAANWWIATGLIEGSTFIRDHPPAEHCPFCFRLTESSPPSRKKKGKVRA